MTEMRMLGRIVGMGLGLVFAWGPAGPGAAQHVSDLPPALQEKVALASETCADFENGVLDVAWGAVRRIDLDGDRQLDWALDESGLACSSAASLFCGTGGCMTHFVIGDAIHSHLTRGWDLVWLRASRVLLSDVHGSRCGGINPTPCVVASVWDPEALLWRSAVADWE
jgi:hypothetical protein